MQLINCTLQNQKIVFGTTLPPHFLNYLHRMNVVSTRSGETSIHLKNAGGRLCSASGGSSEGFWVYGEFAPFWYAKPDKQCKALHCLEDGRVIERPVTPMEFGGSSPKPWLVSVPPQAGIEFAILNGDATDPFSLTQQWLHVECGFPSVEDLLTRERRLIRRAMTGARDLRLSDEKVLLCRKASDTETQCWVNVDDGELRLPEHFYVSHDGVEGFYSARAMGFLLGDERPNQVGTVRMGMLEVPELNRTVLVFDPVKGDAGHDVSAVILKDYVCWTEYQLPSGEARYVDMAPKVKRPDAIFEYVPHPKFPGAKRLVAKPPTAYSARTLLKSSRWSLCRT